MKKIKVNSTNIKSIGYENNVIEVTFIKGPTYRYLGTNKYLFECFLNASSKGKFLNNILKKFVCFRVN